MALEDINGLITLKESMMKQIYESRLEIADLKMKKITVRANAWADAEGIADAKKDYVRSRVADFDNQIDVLEAEIELAYNQIRILDEKTDLELMKDE